MGSGGVVCRWTCPLSPGNLVMDETAHTRRAGGRADFEGLCIGRHGWERRGKPEGFLRDISWLSWESGSLRELPAPTMQLRNSCGVTACVWTWGGPEPPILQQSHIPG